MQQGKMFFFIGVITMSIQGGYSRRIQPGHHIKAVRTVRPPGGRETGPGQLAAPGYRRPIVIACFWIQKVTPFLQAILALIPAFVLVGLAWNLVMLYLGLALYAFGKSTVLSEKAAQLKPSF